LAPGYFSRQDTKTPVKIAVIAMVANMVFNLALIFPLAHAGLALATALSAFLNAGLLLRGLLKQGVFHFSPGWAKWLLQLVSANIAMGALLLYFSPEVNEWLHAGLWTRVQWMASLVVASVAVYGLVLVALGLRPRHLKG